MRVGFEQGDQQFTLEQPGQAVGGWGDGTPTYTSQATVWGRMEPIGGNDRGGVVADADFRVQLWQCRTVFDPGWRLGVAGTARKLQVLTRDPDTRQHNREVLVREIL